MKNYKRGCRCGRDWTIGISFVGGEMRGLLLHVAVFLKGNRFDRQFIDYSCLGH